MEEKVESMIDLRPFCGLFVSDNLSSPFGDDKNTYACNGHIIVRVPFVEGTSRKAPVPVENIKFTPDHQGEWGQIPQYESPEKKVCSGCNGLKRSEECPDCNGEGIVHMSHGRHLYEAECKECDGEGVIPGGDKKCCLCNGDGVTLVDQFAGVKVGGVKLSVALLEKIKVLPGAELYLPAPKSGMVNFRFDGGDGVVMMMKE